jgi:hypothetical protein
MCTICITPCTQDTFPFYLQHPLTFKGKISCAPDYLFSRALIKSRCFNLDLEDEPLEGFFFVKLAGGGGRA